jgi:hypothetical protein
MDEIAPETSKAARVRPVAPPPPSILSKTPRRPPRAEKSSTVPVAKALEKFISSSSAPDNGVDKELEEKKYPQKLINKIDADSDEVNANGSTEVEDSKEQTPTTDYNPFSVRPVTSYIADEEEDLETARPPLSKYDCVPKASPTPALVNPRRPDTIKLVQPRTISTKASMFVSPEILGPGDRNNELYHKNQFSEVAFTIASSLQV